MDTVRVTEQVTHTDQYGNRSHYEVSFERRRAESTTQRMERVEMLIRCNGVERLRVEMPGEVGWAMFSASRQAFEKFDIEGLTGRKVAI